MPDDEEIRSLRNRQSPLEMSPAQFRQLGHSLVDQIAARFTYTTGNDSLMVDIDAEENMTISLNGDVIVISNNQVLKEKLPFCHKAFAAPGYEVEIPELPYFAEGNRP